jgi:PPOX class probable F420-dependent enzyme
MTAHLDVRLGPVTLSDAQRAYLDEIHYAVVATCNPDGSIQQTVVWYLLDGDEICFSCGAGSVKARNLRRSPTISLAVADGRRYLSLQGLAVVGPPDAVVRERLATRYLGPEGAVAWLQRRPDAPRLTVRMTIQKAYGQGV